MMAPLPRPEALVHTAQAERSGSGGHELQRSRVIASLLLHDHREQPTSRRWA
jgi:hypothetical protein